MTRTAMLESCCSSSNIFVQRLFGPYLIRLRRRWERKKTDIFATRPTNQIGTLVCLIPPFVCTSSSFDYSGSSVSLGPYLPLNSGVSLVVIVVIVQRRPQTFPTIFSQLWNMNCAVEKYRQDVVKSLFSPCF